jgi:hypothetical protein
MPVTEDEGGRRSRTLRCSLLENLFAVCQLPSNAPIPEWALSGELLSITRAADELSIVCLAQNVPSGVKADGPWICLKLEGPFPFLQTGVLASFIDPLADAGVPIFAISTYNTDFVLIKHEYWGAALGALSKAGHELISNDESWRKLIE